MSGPIRHNGKERDDMTYLATSINDSAVITEKAGAALDDVRGKAVKYDAATWYCAPQLARPPSASAL